MSTHSNHADQQADQQDDQQGESALTVIVAFGANAAVAAAKSAAAVFTGSASMLAEAAHSWADTGNQVFLLVAQRKSRRPPDASRPLGYGREAYVWSMFAAMGLFVAGAAVSVWHGITELGHEGPVESPGVAYGVLGVAFLLEGASFAQAFRQTRAESRRLDRDVLDHALRSSDPTLRAVLAEDTAALIGLAIAALGIFLHQVTGSAVFDALGSILVGLLLGAVAVVLIERNRRFLTGQESDERLRQGVLERILSLPEVARVTYVRLEFVGPRQLVLFARVDLQGEERETSVAHALRGVEEQLEQDRRITEALITLALPEEPALAPTPS
jgi:cation diffusion facilitator family transporter